MGRSTGDEGKEHASDLEDYLSSAAVAAKGGYDTAKRKAAETLETAKDTISSNHDAAKRKSQETAGRGHDDEL
ncbi:hypothetical protein Nepgr_030456 [Nepenthes gracilis]|uniref:Uncharacterized protein n=1 Tax=Nepenthes gracilis TaxID=150966 RepID=A0AAD3TGI1_NEPGR|nr:hypothetical protein Nepgr_030456 [Nepenthes gracilis]